VAKKSEVGYCGPSFGQKRTLFVKDSFRKLKESVRDPEWKIGLEAASLLVEAGKSFIPKVMNF
jgi:hypothetical protein